MLTKTRRRSVPSEKLTWARAKLGRWTTLQPDLTALTDDELRDLLDLIGKASESSDPDVDAFNPDALGKRDKAKLERLVEQAASQPGVFKKEREDKAFREEVAAIARDALRRPASRHEEAGFFAEVRRQLHTRTEPAWTRSISAC